MADLIDRQAAIDEIDEWIKAFRENGHKESAADACLIQDGIIQLPSVERHGKWVIFNDDDPDLSSFKCSSCGTHFSIDTVFDNYCPHCGARMEQP